MSAQRRPRILCLSLSPIARDARVLRQISVLAELGEVTTVGYGSTPAGATDHVSVPTNLPSLPQTLRGVVGLALRRFRSSELAAPAVRWIVDTLGRDADYDLVVANDARILGAAFAVAGDTPVWADMHEWAPEERTHVLSWRLLVAPFMDYLCRTFLPRAAAVSTVGGEISRLYAERYGVDAAVVRNAAPLADLTPSPVSDDRIRLVHSGAAVHGRNLEGMIDVVRELDDRFTLDLYLVPGGDGGRYLSALHRRADGDERIRFREPVAPSELPAVLNGYDVGVFWIPPVHTNARLTLPNKLFDFVQARLAIAIGPTVEMERVVNEFGLGVISASFENADCVRSLAALSPVQVREFKAAAHVAAAELSFSRDAEAIRGLVLSSLADSRGTSDAEHRGGPL